MISNKKFLLLSLLMAPAAKAENCDQNNCCETESACVKSCDSNSENCDSQKSQECTTCDETTSKTVETEKCMTCEPEDSATNPEEHAKSCETKCPVLNACDTVECGTKGTDCNSCCCQASNEETTEPVRSENFDNNENVIIEETEEQSATRLKNTAIVEAEKTFEHLFKMFSDVSNAYLAMSPSQKTTFAKTIVEFFFNVQKEIRAHSALFEKIGPDYEKASENLRFEFVEVSGRSEEENLQDKFSYVASKLAQFYVDFGYVYKNLTTEEQAELAQIFADIYLEQKAVCQDNSEVLNEIVQIFGKAISAR